MGSGKSLETKDIERIIRNRMKSLNIEGECKYKLLRYILLTSYIIKYFKRSYQPIFVPIMLLYIQN